MCCSVGFQVVYFIVAISAAMCATAPTVVVLAMLLSCRVGYLYKSVFALLL